MKCSRNKDDSIDVTVILDGKGIRASRNQLSAASDFFSTLLNSDMRKSREGIVHITETAMREVLQFRRSDIVKIMTPS